MSSGDPGMPGLLLRRLPDAPRWVEARAALLSGRARTSGFGAGDAGGVVHDDDAKLASFVGPPGAGWESGLGVLGPALAVVAEPPHRGWLEERLPGWRAEEMVVHTLPGAPRRRATGVEARLLDRAAGEGFAAWPRPAGAELRAALARRCPMCVVRVGGLVVAVCHAAHRTETLFDVGIDTAPGYRRRGFAAAAAMAMIDRMAAEGRGPVWAAARSNGASLALAERLGFRPVDAVVVLEKGNDMVTDRHEEGS